MLIRDKEHSLYLILVSIYGTLFLMLMVGRERLVRYPALLAKLFYILIETKSDTAFFFQLFFLAREVYILCFEDIP